MMTVAEVAIRLRASEVSVYRWIASGILPSVRIGHAVRVDPEQLDQFIKSGGTPRRTLRRRAVVHDLKHDTAAHSA